MKTETKVIILLVVLLGFGYLGLAVKALRVKQLKLKWAVEEDKITQSELEKELKRATLINVLLDPKFVFSVD